MGFHDDLRALKVLIPERGFFRPTRAEFVDLYFDTLCNVFRKHHGDDSISVFALFARQFIREESRAVIAEAQKNRDFERIGRHDRDMRVVWNMLDELKRRHGLEAMLRAYESCELIGKIFAHYLAMRLRLD